MNDEYIRRRAMEEYRARPDYFMQLELRMPELVALISFCAPAVQAIRKVGPHPDSEVARSCQRADDVTRQVIQRLRDQHFRYTAEFLETLWWDDRATTPQ